MGPIRRAPAVRRARRPAPYRTKRRRPAVRSKGRKGRTYKKRGTRFRQRGVATRRKLNTNFARNDYRTLRCVAEFPGQVVVNQQADTENTVNFAISPTLFPQFETNKGRFSEFKLTNVQFVIEPRSVLTGGQAIRVKHNEIPYLATRFIASADDAPTLVDMGDIRRTPGYTFVPLGKKSRTIVNVRPTMVERTTIEQPGQDLKLYHSRSVPYMSTDSTALQGTFAVTHPSLDEQNGDELRYDVRCYATLHLRGNLEDIVPVSVEE